MRGVIHPAVQYPAEPLKTETSRAAIPIPQSLSLMLAAHVQNWPGPAMLTNTLGGQLRPGELQKAFRTARSVVGGLPPEFDIN